MNLLFTAVFWLGCGVTGVLSLTPIDQLPSVVLDIWDKAQHAMGFALLAVTGHLAYPRARNALPAGLLAYGALIELAQAATGWRQGDVIDWLADAIGVAIPLLIIRLQGRGRHQREGSAQ